MSNNVNDIFEDKNNDEANIKNISSSSFLSEDKNSGIITITNSVDNYSARVKNSILSILNNNEIISPLIGLEGPEFRLKLLEIINVLRDRGYNFDKIDFSFILTHDVKRELLSTISDNYPILSISRLLEGEKVSNMIFSGIKELNDISYQFTDIFTTKLKNKLISNFDNSLEEGKTKGRLVRSDYKNLTFSFEKEGDTSDLIFDNNNNLKELVTSVLDDISKEEYESISGGFSVDEIYTMVYKFFSLSVGIGYVDKGARNSKYIGFYQAEMAGRLDRFNKITGLNENKYDLDIVKKYSTRITSIKTAIIDNYNGKKFTNNGVKYDIVVSDNKGNYKISDILLRFIRKGKIIEPKAVELWTIQYLTYLNDGFDFISPSVGADSNKPLVNRVNEQMKSGIIDVDLIEKNYKGTYTKDALENISSGKKGARIFIDIIDMGIMNMEDYSNVASFISGLNDEQVIYKNLLNTGGSVTRKFMRFVFDIKEKYPNAKISLGGDEIRIFIEGETDGKEEEVFMLNTLEKLSLRGRSTVNYGNLMLDDMLIKNSDKTIFDILDNFTGVNKLFETKIEEIIYKKGLQKDIEIPKSSVFYIDEKCSKVLGVSYGKFLQRLENNLDIDKVIEFLEYRTLNNKLSGFLNKDIKLSEIKGFLNKDIVIKSNNSNLDNMGGKFLVSHCNNLNIYLEMDGSSFKILALNKNLDK